MKKHLIWIPFLLVTMVGCGTLAALVDPTADTRNVVAALRGDIAAADARLAEVESGATPTTGNKWVDLALIGTTLLGGGYGVRKGAIAAVNAERDKKYMAPTP